MMATSPISADVYSRQSLPTKIPSLLLWRSEGGEKGESRGDKRGERVLMNRLHGVDLQQHRAVMC